MAGEGGSSLSTEGKQINFRGGGGRSWGVSSVGLLGKKRKWLANAAHIKTPHKQVILLPEKKRESEIQHRNGGFKKKPTQKGRSQNYGPFPV